MRKQSKSRILSGSKNRPLNLLIIRIIFPFIICVRDPGKGRLLSPNCCTWLSAEESGGFRTCTGGVEGLGVAQRGKNRAGLAARYKYGEVALTHARARLGEMGNDQTEYNNIRIV